MHMKKTINIKKYIILTLICLSLFVTWYAGKAQASGLDTTAKMASSLTTPAYSFWPNFANHLTMEHHANNRRVQAEIRMYQHHKDKFDKIMRAATPYIYYIHQRTEKMGLPDELALIPVIESEFSPGDRSWVGATGLWQLMPATARQLGVSVRGGYDGRRNVIYSTNAALAYFRDLGKTFHGNWELAIGAYNTGPGNMRKAVRANGSRDFFRLERHLADETKHYVPRLLAVAAIVKHPAKYGFTLPIIKNEPYFTQVQTKKPVNLAKVAKVTGMKVDQLKKINPDYNHRIIAKHKTYMLLVPVSKVTTVKKVFADKVVG